VRFEVVATEPGSNARAGVLHTPHGEVRTPAFMPVGTLGSVKALTPDDVRSTGARVILANTYHLLLRPGVEVVSRLGGLHGFMRWDGPILTDSGGFQVFSLSRLRRITPEGVTFLSHVDGATHTLTPERVIDAEAHLGADLIMPLDACVSASATRADTEAALELTQAWWARSLAAHRRHDQALFALIQGGMFPDLRQQAARAAAAEPAPGFAIGGLSVGEPKQLTMSLLRSTLAELPAGRPRYLMGVGHPLDVAQYARLGVDLFDCVLPTRLGRNGTVWIDRAGSRLDLQRRALLTRTDPLMPDCGCMVCQDWSIGRLAALFQSGEPLAYRLASVHNVTLLAAILRDVRSHVVYTGRKMLSSAGSVGQ
jgi:queuine tRNA-ribosyltransferase